jgi:hypothetical protein
MNRFKITVSELDQEIAAGEERGATPCQVDTVRGATPCQVDGGALNAATPCQTDLNARPVRSDEPAEPRSEQPALSPLTDR